LVSPNSATNTTAIHFVFSAVVSGLTASDINITNGTGSVTKGTLTGSGQSWSLGITVATAGNVTVNITKSGIESTVKTVAVVKEVVVSDITYTATDNNTTNTTAIYFLFSADVLGLTASDITITDGTGSVTKGTLTGSGQYWTLGITVNTPGNITVKIIKSGIESAVKTVAVAKGSVGNDITYTATADSAIDTTAINFSFGEYVYGLTTSDIIITNGTGSVTKGTLTGYGYNWTLRVTVNTPGNITVYIFKSDIEYAQKTVAVGKLWTAVSDSKFVSTDSIKGIAWGNGKFVAVGGNGKIAWSSDGATWNAVSDSKFGTSTIGGIAYGNSKFVAFGDSGKIAWSTDGATWNAVSDSKFGSTNNNIGLIAWVNDRFIAWSYNKMAYSLDGVTWTITDNIIDYSSKVIIWGNNKFVLASNYEIAYSSDGTTWIVIKNTFGTVNGIAWGNGKFVAVGEDGKIAWSTGL